MNNLEEFQKLTKPLIKYLNDNWHPHATIIVSANHAELVTGEMAFSTDEYVKD